MANKADVLPYSDISCTASILALDAYRQPSFLVTPHGAPIFTADFGDNLTLEVSLEIIMPDGHCLSSRKHDQLRSDIYDALCVQALRSHGRVKNIGPQKKRQRLLKAIAFIDYILLNHFDKVARFGFSSLSANDMIGYLRTVAASNRVIDKLYDSDITFRNFIIKQGQLLSGADLERAKTKHAAVFDLENTSDLDFGPYSSSELIAGRAYLAINKLYKKQSQGFYTPNPISLTSLIYKNTLLASSPTILNPSLDIFNLGAQAFTRRELRSVPVKSTFEDTRCHTAVYASYRLPIENLTRLNPFNVGISQYALQEALQYDAKRTLDLKTPGHTTPLPTPHVIYALKRAISFYYEHADHLLESLCRALIAAKESGLDAPRFFAYSDISLLLTDASLSIGIDRWSMISVQPEKINYIRADNFHGLLRDHKGLFELCRVLFGAMMCITGTMMAARQGELNDLTENNVNERDMWAQLSTRKSGHGTLRRKHWRPIPQIVVEILGRLSQLHARLKSIGITTPSHLFACPTLDGPLSVNRVTSDSCLDIFCDFIEMPTDEQGRRYYIREHQLRQFFILAFFYAAGIGGIDTLRWFVRHYDPAHLWAYLRQNVPGATMIRYKSIAVKGLIKNNAPDVANLTLFLIKNLGANRLEVMADDELIEYLTDLQENGDIIVEPLFLTENSTKTLRLGVTIFGD